MAIHKFARKILAGESIPFFGDGSTRRDYTFVRDIVDGLLAAIDYQGAAFEILNLGNNRTVSLMEMVQGLENALGQRHSLTISLNSLAMFHRLGQMLPRQRDFSITAQRHHLSKVLLSLRSGFKNEVKYLCPILFHRP